MTELAERLAVAETKIQDLTGWQKTQNGALIRLAEKVDKLVYMMLGGLALSAGTLMLELLRK